MSVETLRTVLVSPRQSIWGVTCLGLVENYMFSHLSPWNPINVCWNPQNSAHFSKMINLRGHMPRFTLKMNIFPSISLEPHKCVLKSPEQCLFFQDNWFKGSHAYIYSENACFPIYLLKNPINVCWNPQNSARFSETINLRGHMPRFTLKMNVFPSISLETP